MSAQPAGTWRLSDADRLAAVEALGEHYATGRLDKAEYDERSDRVMAARSSTDLPPVFADLPLPHGAVVPVAQPRAVRPVPGQPRFVPGPWLLLLLIPVLVVTAHAPWLLIIGVVLVLKLRAHGRRRAPFHGRRVHG